MADLEKLYEELSALTLLEAAELKEIVVNPYEINVQEETRGLYRRYGCAGMLGVFLRMLFLYVKNPAYRKFVKEVRKDGVAPKNLDEYFGYGLYVGQK